MGTDARLADAIEACRSDWEPGSAEAAEAFGALLDRWPDELAAVEAAAIALDDAGRTEDAIVLYERALAGLQGTELRRCFLRLGNALRQLGLHERSAAVLERGLEEFPASRSLRTFLALSLHELGRADAALALVLVVLVDPVPSPDLELFAPEVRLRAAALLGRDG